MTGLVASPGPTSAITTRAPDYELWELRVARILRQRRRRRWRRRRWRRRRWRRRRFILAIETNALARVALARVFARRHDSDRVAGARPVADGFHLALRFSRAVDGHFHTSCIFALSQGVPWWIADRPRRDKVWHALSRVRVTAALALLRRVQARFRLVAQTVDARLATRIAVARASVVAGLCDANTGLIALPQRSCAHAFVADARRVLGLVLEADTHARARSPSVLGAAPKEEACLEDALGFGTRELRSTLVVGGTRHLRGADLAVGIVLGLGVVLVLLAIGLVLGLARRALNLEVTRPRRPVALATRRFLGRGSTDCLRVAERRREHEREERDEREPHRGATLHDEVKKEEKRRKGRGVGRGRGARVCGGSETARRTSPAHGFWTERDFGGPKKPFPSSGPRGRFRKRRRRTVTTALPRTRHRVKALGHQRNATGGTLDMTCAFHRMRRRYLRQILVL